jgi:cell division septal protein FtsQ
MGKIGYLDVSDRDNIVINIYGAEIKMGQEDFTRKIYQMKNIMNDPKINMKDIKYIDLRFEDPVIAPK